MNSLMLLSLTSVLVPLLFPLLAVGRNCNRLLRCGLPLLPLPALALALLTTPGWQLELPYLLTGGVWIMDDLRRLFLLLTAILWATAGLFAAGYLGTERLRGFCVFWGLTLTGNLGLVISGDISSFYSFFALMTFASYGLVIHERTPPALRAGRIFLVMALLGEVTLLAGLLTAAGAAGSMTLSDLPPAIAEASGQHLIIGLLLAGFGVKAGLPLLHFWLPLAHPVAPTPASAVLSGAMIKAGLLGWLVTLPLGEVALPGWGTLVTIAGAAGALGGAVIGVCQKDPKAVLAYSSISQMGLMTIMVGVALSDPQRVRALLPVIAVYALHHGLAKGSLFLSVGLSLPRHRAARGVTWLLIALPGLSLAGLPFTSGALSKLAMKSAFSVDYLSFPFADALGALMAAGAIATMLLVLRYLWTLQKKLVIDKLPLAVYSGWALTTGASLVLFWWMPWGVTGLISEPAWLPKLYQIWALFWPALTGFVIALVALGLGLRVPTIPPGDGIVFLEYWVKAVMTESANWRRISRQKGWQDATAGRFESIVLLWTRKIQSQEDRLRRHGALMMVIIIVALILL